MAQVFGISFAVSLVNFFPYKNEASYSLQTHLDYWPIMFSVVLFIGICAVFESQLTRRLSEETTLLHSFALTYWLLEHARSENSPFWIVLLILPPLLYTFVHAFTQLPLTAWHRLLLSLWSSVVMLVFGIAYFVSVYSLPSVEELLGKERISEAILIGVECFLLGVAGPYIAHNLMMLLPYLPSRHRFFNKAYFIEVAELNKKHITRYATTQARLKEVLFVTIFVVALLTTNYHYQIVAPTLALWVTLLLVPSVFRGDEDP